MPTPKSKPSKTKKPEPEVEDSEPGQQSGGEEGSGSEGEYEIEAILDAKKGQFGKVWPVLLPLARKTRRKLIFLCAPEQDGLLRQMGGLWPRTQQLGSRG